MFRFLKQLLIFRVGQKTARGFAKSIGMGRISSLVGLIGGIKYLRRHA